MLNVNPVWPFYNICNDQFKKCSHLKLVYYYRNGLGRETHNPGRAETFGVHGMNSVRSPAREVLSAY